MKTYDPKLRLAMHDIQEVLKRHDVAAFISLGSKTHGEFMLFTDTTWSVIKPEQLPDGRQAMRFRAKGIKVGTPEHDNLEATAAFVCNSADLCNRFAQIFYSLKAEIGRRSELTHEPITDDRINNDDRPEVHQ